jgi:hypothetical protein
VSYEEIKDVLNPRDTYEWINYLKNQDIPNIFNADNYGLSLLLLEHSIPYILLVAYLLFLPELGLAAVLSSLGYDMTRQLGNK